MRLSWSSLPLLLSTAAALRYDVREQDYNLNSNQSALHPTDYWGARDNHKYWPSPSSWRFPYYTLFLDKFVNGRPENDNANGTIFEQDVLSTQLRNGGDIEGLVDSLDYLQGMGVKAIYIAGTPMFNLPWGADGYSPIDFTLLDRHFGTIQQWQDAIDAIHAKGMYVLLDNTVATMSDLIGFQGFLNESAPFTVGEHKVEYKTPQYQYPDFSWGNQYNETCSYPRFWFENGMPVGQDVNAKFVGCHNSEFDQYGDTEAFGVFPDWQRQLSKFASVQDRLREWHKPVLEKIKRMSCITIAQLDIDGFRIDKATQVTPDALSEWSQSVRECARKLGKSNFFIPGEITGGDTFGAVYLGRGRQPDMRAKTALQSLEITNTSSDKWFIRAQGRQALDAAAFHYSVYRYMIRFLGMDGNLTANYDTPSDWVGMWDTLLLTNDLLNSNTGEWDVRHLYGTSNQDVFRWPSIRDGVERNLLALFIVSLHMPGSPKLLWGEEQGFYLLDNTAANYIFGRQSMASAVSWQTHGCYTLGSEQFFQFSASNAAKGCEDDWNSLDHRDPSAPIRNTIKHMFQMRDKFPVLNDGLYLQSLSNQTRYEYLPGSNSTPTEKGIWSVLRSAYPSFQDLGDAGNQSIWLVYSNENDTRKFSFDCNDAAKALVAPFPDGTIVKDLFYPHAEFTLAKSPVQLKVNGKNINAGCISDVTLSKYGHMALVAKADWVGPGPMVTKFTPGHDARVLSKAQPGEKETLDISFQYSQEMDCNGLAQALQFNSVTEDGSVPKLQGAPTCQTITDSAASFTGYIPGAWEFKATLENVANGLHEIVVKSVTAKGGVSTNTTDHFYFRIGQSDNPMVFPRSANFTRDLLVQKADKSLYVAQKAAGADQFRYSLDWGTTWSAWTKYQGGNYSLPSRNWSGTKRQEWDGQHVIMQYYSKLLGSSAHLQHGDAGIDPSAPPRRFPHLFVHGPYNQYGYDAGLNSQMQQDVGGLWKMHLMAEWPNVFQINVWGINPDGKPDQTFVFGDVDQDNVLDRLPPSTLKEPVVNVSMIPPHPFLSYMIYVNDADLRYELVPVGSRIQQMVLFLLMFLLPVLTAALGVWIFMKSFYQIKFNQDGVTEKPAMSLAVRRLFRRPTVLEKEISSGPRRKILIATMEYLIEDWDIRVKIGGLGVMAETMGKHLGHEDLIWVIPCVGGVDYPVDTPAAPMAVIILGKEYIVDVQYHFVRNITYVLLDTPVFRQQTKEEPYPARMDDLDSAIYYSAWNQCIALAIKRFNVDLYHMNDYHGALAPTHLLPETIPCCLSLHNAEFQGLWPMRTEKEKREVCNVYNLDLEIALKYVQFGDVFNLLHAGASYLRIHQRGFGAVGVSKKYGKRSWARYPIFWGLSKIGTLPNPDPKDTEENLEMAVDPAMEEKRADHKRQAQEWANLDQNPDAELLVFVGRWSMQKGIDLIADVMPSILEENKNVQLMCIGPVIDLYGKFAALKMNAIMHKYPGRVHSRPKFTNIPPFIFSGADFALIPSRDEPFGLVAVEFGRKGALGVGARVGGLGQMPGWWYNVESTTTAHLIHQFKGALREALASKPDMRAKLRVTSAKQRFPVAQWVDDLEKLQTRAIEIHEKELMKPKAFGRRVESVYVADGHDQDDASVIEAPTGLSRALSLGRRAGPGHAPRMSSLPAHRFTMTIDSEDEDESTYGDHLVTSDQVQRGQFLDPRVSTTSFKHFDSDLDSPSTPDTPDLDMLAPPSAPFSGKHEKRLSNSSVLSFNSVTEGREDFMLQKVDPNFTDADGSFYKAFERSLGKLDGKTSEDLLCIEDYLVKSEKKWFSDYRSARLGTKSPGSLPKHSPPSSVFGDAVSDRMHRAEPDQFMLGPDYTPPTGLKKLLLRRFRDWPIYSFLLAFGQIVAANSYQITLLTGQIGQTAAKLYIVATIYLVTSVLWWFAFRTVKSVYTLSVPFAIYGVAFFWLAISPFAGGDSRGALFNVATGFYAAASSSGSIFFAQNFGDEGGAPTKSWVYRACIIQGTQQAYVLALWYWGSRLTSGSADGFNGATSVANSYVVTGICIPLMGIFFAIGWILYKGLPDYYRQEPGQVPSFYQSLYRRKIVLWFFITVVIQNFFLSAPYGRNWAFLWSSRHAPAWSVFLLCVLFFGVVWIVMLWIFGKLSKNHSWILPVFAIGLGAPRWCQMLWGTSGIGASVPWAGGPIAGALISRSLWLWLGVLDAIQGVGFGMILLQTLTRIHITFTLLAAQVLGSIATIIARACAPNRIGPGDIFPDFSNGYSEPLSKAWFWIGLFFQIFICAGFFTFFRKEQLSKP